MTDTSRLARRTTFAAIATAVGTALIGVAIWAQRPRLAPIEVSQQTTYIITPTRPDGWVDYPEAVDWMRRASLDAGGANAALPLLKALGQGVLPVGVNRGAILERLGVKAPGEESSVLKPLREVGADGAGAAAPPPPVMDWLRARCGVPGAASGPGNDNAAASASFARIVAWLAQSETPLSELRTASQGASLYIPVPRDHRAPGNVDRVNPSRFADAPRALACRAALKLLQSDAPASWADVDATWRLGMLAARAASVDEYSTAEAIWKTALVGTVDLALSPQTNEALLSVMQAFVDGKLAFAPATETWMFRRLAALDAAGTPLVAPMNPAAPPAGPLLARIGTAAKLEAINQPFDAIDVALQGADARQRIARVDQAAATIAPIGALGRSLLSVEIQAVSSQRLASIALALAKRQRDKGRLPASLDELGDLPKDPGSGGAFHYAPDDRRFRLYGVGGDGRDDGGDSGKDVVVIAHEPPRLPTP
jgi:hypothetical protein